MALIYGSKTFIQLLLEEITHTISDLSHPSLFPNGLPVLPNLLSGIFPLHLHNRCPHPLASLAHLLHHLLLSHHTPVPDKDKSEPVLTLLKPPVAPTSPRVTLKLLSRSFQFLHSLVPISCSNLLFHLLPNPLA